MDEQDKIRLLGDKIEAADTIVVGGASGMSAASGFKFYYADDDVFKKKLPAVCVRNTVSEAILTLITTDV